MNKTSGRRGVFLVGSYPASMGSDKAAMKDMLAIVGKQVRSLPGGETRRPKWLLEDLELLRKDPDVKVTREGNYADYKSIKMFGIKSGHTLNPDAIVLTYYTYAKENWHDLRELRKQVGRPDLPLQIGFPGTLDPALFAFGQRNPIRGFTHRKAFAAAYKREVDRIWNDASIGRAPGSDKNKDIVWQIELPGEVGLLTKVRLPEFIERRIAKGLAQGIVQQIADLPEGARVVLHMCNGDLGNKPFSRPKDTRATTHLTLAVMRQWPEGRHLEAIHFPLAAGDQQPSLKDAYYASLRLIGNEIKDSDTRFIAGFVHEGASIEDQKRVLKMVEELIGKKVDVATACGLGRRTKEGAHFLLNRCIELASA